MIVLGDPPLRVRWLSSCRAPGCRNVIDQKRSPIPANCSAHANEAEVHSQFDHLGRIDLTLSFFMRTRLRGWA